MSTNIVVPVPAFLQEMAVELRLMLDSVVLMDREDDKVRVCFEFKTVSREFEVCFDFVILDVILDNDFYKEAKFEGLMSVTCRTTTYDRVLELRGDITERKLVSVIKWFVRK